MPLDGAQWAWRPQPGPQEALLACPADEILFGGARGGGKSSGAIGLWLQHAGTYGAGAQGIFFRRRYKDLEGAQIQMGRFFRPLGATWKAQSQSWLFPNGAVLRMRHLWDERDADSYQGQEFTFLCFEEAGQWPSPKPVDMLRATLRSVTGVRPILLMTANPGGSGHCVPFGEVLTPSGWRPIQDFAVGDPVMTVAHDGVMQETRVSQVHSSFYDGDIVHVNARGLEMVCTPNHRVAKVGGVRRDTGRAYSLVPFEKLPGQATILRTVRWQGRPLGTVSVPPAVSRKTKLTQPLSLPGPEYCALLGWMLTEGCVVHRDGELRIDQMKPDGRALIADLLDRCGFKWRWSSNGAYISSRAWANHFAGMGRSYQKRIPRWVLDATQAELQPLLDAMLAGDGTRRPQGGATFYTSSPGLADDFAELALRLGYLVDRTVRQRPPGRFGDKEAQTRRTSYEVNIKRTLSGGTELLTGQHVYKVETETKRRSEVSRIPFRGTVYCLGIEGTHSFIIRQNGSVWVSGNSWLKARFVVPARRGYHPIRDPETGQVRVFIPSKLEDNPILLRADPYYRRRLQQVGSASLVRAWLDGDWDIVAGGAFDDVWNAERQVLPRDFTPPASWGWRRAMDWGSARPAAVGIWAISDGTAPEGYEDTHHFPKGSMVMVSELYTVARDDLGEAIPNTGLEWDNTRLGREIARVSGTRRFGISVADPSIFTRQGGPSIYEQMAAAARKEGDRFDWVKADNSRIAGWQRMRGLMRASADARPEGPGLWVTENCTEWLRTVPVLQRDQKTPDDVDTEGEDHHGDQTRYAAMATEARTGAVGPIVVR